ncbi:MAG: enoyl-CoA hydratase [Sulfobacillus thermosulfidooxidans]|nr:MAG: enoyl-CoA hydratase [Sulfobacillus thermosulfidooxidans]
MSLIEMNVFAEERIATLALNNPRRRHALSHALLAELEHAVKELAAKRSVNVVIIQSSGPAFSSGHDLTEVLDQSPEDVHSLLLACGQTMRAVSHAPQVYIAQVQGIATAAGCQLVAACDLAVSARSARYATPGVKIGLFCSTPAVHVTRNIGRKKAAELLFTGEFMSAADALTYGLVNRVVDDEELEQETWKLARTIAQYSLNTLEVGKRTLHAQWQMNDDQALDFATEVIARQAADADAKEGIAAFLSKREPVWKDRSPQD